ncbi:MAG TPA: class I SAM-dependent methyltransferase, partial [Bryobacteraceae bacterium]|nr:class I SAM-dependent methyltransferase [Bryobacteraceae bacterium]
MSIPAQPAAYDAFAWFYERYWNRPFHGCAYRIVKRVLLARLPPGARILDVGCGTGYLAAKLTARGFRVTGVDVSPEMAACARRHAPGAEFYAEDMRHFRPPGPFDAAVCTFDTLNHILTAEDLNRTIANVAATLAPGGLFFFDMLLEEAYREGWSGDISIVEPDHVLIVKGEGFDPRNGLAHCRLTMFRKLNGHWRRSDSVVTERCYSRQAIGAALDQAGFRTTEAYSAHDLGMEGTLGVGRVFFLADR